jgi:hypothetical protein
VRAFSVGRHPTVTNYRVRANVLLRTHGVLPLHARSGGVVLQVALWVGIGPVPIAPLHLPLGVNQPWGQEDVVTGTRRNGLLRFHGQDYVVTVWTGRTATSGDRAALLDALASVDPAH